MRLTIDTDGPNFTWKAEGMDGFQAIGLLCDVLFDLHSYYIESPARPDFIVNGARVCIEVYEETLNMAYRPERVDPLVVQGMLGATLAGFIKKNHKGEFCALEAMIGAIQIPFGDKDYTPYISNIIDHEDRGNGGNGAGA